ncbi:hypothetical protein QFZ28_002361 [Neobacillus niacini]|uniref:twin-arginine translocation signal domain-containing protein n=1 Tax=Neobacillus niacini TaxID=86668 RepID=UPI0027805441|nr:twin-arginine translocation signal domain-containing protein [Neobacillus niacini]MDQ1001961.1 hypothetical protein [Neobacillus niacini]
MPKGNPVKRLLANKMQRRTFLKWSGAIGVPVIAGGVGTKILLDKQKEENVASASEWDKVVSTCSIIN